MISEKMEKALNDQFKAEIESAYLYLAMSAYSEAEDLPGMALWLRYQYEEEMFHAFKLYDYVNERSGRAKIPAIGEQEQDWKSPLDMFKHVYKHEQHVTALINDLVATARAEKDNATEMMLQWFVNEQVEEEANSLRVVKMLERVGDSGQGMFMVDAELAKRPAPTPPDQPAQ